MASASWAREVMSSLRYALTVARFTLRRLPRLARVGGLRVRRRGSVLQISWRAVAGAQLYAVYVHGTDGNVHAYTIKAGHHSSVVGGIARSTAGSVTITAIRARDHGPHASAGFRALARLRTGVHPLSHQRHK